jgi:hypothetical protein
MESPTNYELATNRELWMTYVDPNNEDAGAFDAMTTDEKVAMIEDLWPEREQA